MKNTTTNLKTESNDSLIISDERRKFIGKFGKLAAVTPVAVTVLMSSYSSKAMASNDDGGDVI